MIKIIITFLIAFLISGCSQNGFSKFYTPYLQEPLKPTKTVQYYTYSNDNDILDAESKGYQVIGYSGFTDVRAPSKEQAISQAKKVGADIVMVSWKFQNTETYAQPVMNYTPGTTSTTYSNANAYGSNGSSAYGSGRSTTYTQGTYSTSYVQQTAQRYAYSAYYLKKLDISKFQLGVSYANKTTQLSKKIGTNAGCLIRLVYHDTPAFYSDIMKDDVILKANNKKVLSCKNLNKILDTVEKTVSFSIWRNGKIITINDIKLNK